MNQRVVPVPFLEQHHQFIDSIGVQMGSMLTPKLFRAGIQTPPFDEHLDAVNPRMSSLALSPGTRSIEFDTRNDTVQAGYQVATPIVSDRPTVLFHHGIGEDPYDASFRRIFQPEQSEIDANLIAVEAPFHRSFESFTRGTESLGNVLTMQAVSVSLLEALRERIHNQVGTPVLVSGISLGGFVTNLHHIHCGTADRYLPLLAGLAEEDVFLNSSYRRGVSKLALNQEEFVTDRLNFESEFAETDPSGVHPMLAQYDTVVRYPIQVSSYNGRPIETIEGGHLTGSVATSRIRDHIDRFVRREAEVPS